MQKFNKVPVSSLRQIIGLGSQKKELGVSKIEMCQSKIEVRSFYEIDTDKIYPDLGILKHTMLVRKGFVISDFLKAEISAAENFSKYQRFSATEQNIDVTTF